MRTWPFRRSVVWRRGQTCFELFGVHLIDQSDLSDSVGRIHVEFEAGSEFDGVVVRIDPVDDPASAGLAGQFEENSAPELVDTTGAEAPVGRISNRFDVEAGCRIVLTEFEEELKSLAFDGLLHLGHVLVHRDVHRSAPSPSPFPSSLLLSEVDAEELSTPRSTSIDVTVSTVADTRIRSEEHTSELQSRCDLVCRLLLETKNYKRKHADIHTQVAK